MPPLRRSMSFAHATSIVAGIIIGASIFVQPSEITRLVPSPRGLMLVWLAAGALTVCGALVCAELAAVFPETGGVYLYLKKIFSPAIGYLWGWAMFWSVHSGIIAALAVVLARYIAYFVPLGEPGMRAVAICAVLTLSLINYLGIAPGGALQLVLTSAKLIAIAAMVALLFTLGHRPATMTAGIETQPITLRAYGLAVAAGLFAFGGFHMVTYVAGEVRDPERTVPRALFTGTLLVTAAYMVLNAAYLHVLPVSELARSVRVAADATEHSLGTQAGGAIALLVILSTAGSLNGIILAGPRVYYAMAQDGLVFRWLGAVDARRRTPHLAITAQAVWSSVLVATNSYRELFNRVIYTEWLFFALLGAGLVVLRRRGGYKPRFLGQSYLLVPLLFIVGSLGVVANLVRANPRGSALGLGLILLGVPVYFVWSQLTRHQNEEAVTLSNEGGQANKSP